MFRRMILSIFGGALLAVALTFGQTAMGACDGRCPDTLPGGSVFDSCSITYVCPPDRECYEADVKCFYTGVTIIN